MLSVHCANQRPACYRFQRRPEISEEALAACRGLVGEAARVVSGVSEIAPRSIEEQERNDSDER